MELTAPVFVLSICLSCPALAADPVGVVYGTYIGGRRKDGASAIALHPDGGVYVVGSTPSGDFPTTKDSFQPATRVDNDDSIGFLARLSSDGSKLAFSTYVGGSFRTGVNAVAVDRAGRPWVAGGTCSDDLPVSRDAFQTSAASGLDGVEACDAFVASFSADGRRLQSGSYLGGSRAENASGIALDARGCPRVTSLRTLIPSRQSVAGDSPLED